MSSVLQRETAAPGTDQRQAVNDYFNQTHDDYRWLWGIDWHWGLHCGYFDTLHRTHRSAVVNMSRHGSDSAERSCGRRRLRHRRQLTLAGSHRGVSDCRCEHQCHALGSRPTADRA